MVKIMLKKEMETLLITLYSKALMSESGQIITDKKAEQVLQLLDYDFKKLAVNKKTQVFMALRSAIIDDFATDFLRRNPSARVLHLGCGLDFRAQRIEKANSLWYDLDYPEVMDLKRQFCVEDQRYRFIASSVNDFRWLDGVEYGGEPVLVIAEGLTMYLSPEEIERLFTAINTKFSSVVYIFDVYSKLSVELTQKRLNSLLNRTGAQIKWGIDNPKELERLGMSYEKSLYLNDERFVKTIRSGYFRIMFRLTMGSKTVNNAMRILIYAKGAKAYE